MRAGRAPAAALAALALLVGAAEARAEDGDGLYGRFDGDLELRGSAGVALLANAPSLALSFSALYLSTAGLYATYTEGFGADAAVTLRSASAGVRIAPAFLARWALAFEGASAHADLLLDSLSLDLGAWWGERRPGPGLPGAAWREVPGFEFGVGFSMPFLPRTNGPRVGLRGALRWGPATLAGAPYDAALEGALVAVTFDWNHVLRTGLVDAGDRRPR